MQVMSMYGGGVSLDFFNQDYFTKLFLEHLDGVLESKTIGNKLKKALINSLDEHFEMVNTDEPRYRRIDRDIDIHYNTALDNYYLAFQFGLATISTLIATGELTKRFPSVAVENWCSWYANIVSTAQQDQIKQFFERINGYQVGNEFNADTVNEESYILNLSNLKNRYKKEFGQ